MKRILTLAVGLLLLASVAYAQYVRGITEEDGSPACWGYQVKFPNTTVTDNGDGTCSYVAAAGAEVNNLETVTTDIGDDEVPTGTAANTVVYKAVPDCNAADRAISYEDSTNTWGCTTGFAAGSGDSVSIDSVGVVDPDFIDTTTIGITDTANTVTMDVNPDSLDFTELADSMTLDASTQVSFGANDLIFQVNNPGSNAFEINGTGAFTADLVHIHQHTGNPTGGTLLYLESVDTDITPMFVVHQDKADIDAAVVALLVDAVDDDDASWTPFEIRDDSDVANDLLFSIDYTGKIIAGILDGETIEDDTIDDDSLDFADITCVDITTTDCGAITTASPFTFSDNGEFIENSTANGHIRLTNAGAGAGLDNYLDIDLGENWQWGVTLSAGGSGGTIVRFGSNMQIGNDVSYLFGDQSGSGVMFDTGGTDGVRFFTNNDSGKGSGYYQFGLKGGGNQNSSPDDFVDYATIALKGNSTTWANRMDLSHSAVDGYINIPTGNVVIVDSTSLGAEKVTNGTFTGNANSWTLNAGYTYNANAVDKDGDGVGTLLQTSANMQSVLVVGEVYQLQFTISSYTTGWVTPSVGGVAGIRVGGDTATITHRQYFKITDTSDLTFTPTNPSRFTIDDIVLKQITDGGLKTVGTVTAGAVATEGNVEGATLTEGGVAVSNDNEIEAVVEPLIDTLANLSSAGGQPVAFADAGADAFWGWDDAGGAQYENLTAAEAMAIIGGAATDLDANGAVAWGNIGAGELADNTVDSDDFVHEDWGEVTNATGSVVVDATHSGSAHHTIVGGGRSLTTNGADLDADAELYTHTKCVVIETPTSADSFIMYHVELGAQATAAHCIVEDATSATIDIEQCDVAGDNCTDIEAGMVCDVGGQADDGIDAADLDVDDWIRVNVTATNGTPGHVTACLTFVMDD